MAAPRLSQRQQRILRWWVADHQRLQGMLTNSPQALVRALQGDKGNISTLETRGWIVIGRSAGGKAEYSMLTPEGQKWDSQFTVSCD